MCHSSSTSITTPSGAISFTLCANAAPGSGIASQIRARSSAGVALRFPYGRADGNGDLFLAVYEHGLSRVRAGQLELERDGRWAALGADERVCGAIGEIGARFRENAAFLRSVGLLASSVGQVAQRGAAYRGESEGDDEQFDQRLRDVGVRYLLRSGSPRTPALADRFWTTRRQGAPGASSPVS